MHPNVGLGAKGEEERGWGLWLAGVLGICLSAVFIIARLAQRLLKTGLGIDEYRIIVTLVASSQFSMIECRG